jgi:hypothetical protein
MKKKKNLGAFIKAFQETRGEPLKGGFGTLRGGNADLPAVNDHCNNDYSCANTNVPACTNSFNCMSSSNKGCTNSGHCFA